MKKNYMKPSLLSETFVENIMSEETEKVFLSSALDLYLNGQKFTGILFNDGNALNSIKYSDLN